MDQEHFYLDNAVYQIYPRSFCDSNGDGIGDLQGIISKLDYLSQLGVKILWLSPIYPSPNCDYGYDISDYKAINPEYGTMEDFEMLIKETEKRGMKIVMDLVVNHTSDLHPWFKASMDPSSPYHDYYIWRKGKKNNKLPPNNWTSMFTGPAWTYVPKTDMWYLHLFTPAQPDLNWHNQKVMDEVEDILSFWLSKGVYGFRCDSINIIYKNDLEDSNVSMGVTARGLDKYMNTQGNHAILHKWYEDIFSKGDHIVIGETNNVTYQDVNRFNKEECSMCFEFTHVSKAHYKPQNFIKIIRGWQENVEWNANYLENHDQNRSIPKYGDAKHYYKQTGKALCLLNLLLRGTPFIYQGEEIGMLNYPKLDWSVTKDVVPFNIRKIAKHYLIPYCFVKKFCYDHDRDNERMPMQWSSKTMAGFTSSSSSWLPIGPDYKKINVEDNLKDPDSILNFYKKVLKLREEHACLRRGKIAFDDRVPSGVISFLREDEKEKIRVVINLTKHVKRINLVGVKALASNYVQTSEDYTSLRPYEALAYLSAD
jgi:oligo-1,6-glucosidase